MLSIIACVPRNREDSCVDWCKQRQTVGRKLASKVGFWSEVWAKRVIDWYSHVERSRARGQILWDIHCWRGADWLTAKRLQFVASAGSVWSRNRPDAGRLGTRKIGGKPQPRWHEGVSLAKALHEVRSESLIGSATLSIGTRIRQA